MWNGLSKIVNILLSLLYPPKCYVCKNIIEQGKPLWFCEQCEAAIETIKPPVCKKCGAHVEGKDKDYCEECRFDLNHNKFQRNISFLIYDDIVRDIIHNFKYYGRKDYAEGLVELAFNKTDINFMEDIDIIIPVPLHIDRLKERGFNQAEVIADFISKKTNVPICNDALIRKRSTQKQSLSGYAQRRTNMKGAFMVSDKEKIGGKSIMLVDDIYTTGSTLSECASVLYASGSKNVISLTIAKTIKNNKTHNKIL